MSPKAILPCTVPILSAVEPVKNFQIVCSTSVGVFKGNSDRNQKEIITRSLPFLLKDSLKYSQLNSCSGWTLKPPFYVDVVVISWISGAHDPRHSWCHIDGSDKGRNSGHDPEPWPRTFVPAHHEARPLYCLKKNRKLSACKHVFISYFSILPERSIGTW